MASAWRIEILPKPRRALNRFRRAYGENAYTEVLHDILVLEDDPIPSGATPLRGTTDQYRIYTYRSLFRIVYQVISRRRHIFIMRFGPRPPVYSGLDKW